MESHTLVARAEPQTELLQIAFGQDEQRFEIDFLLFEDGGILPEAMLVEPLPDLRHVGQTLTIVRVSIAVLACQLPDESHGDPREGEIRVIGRTSARQLCEKGRL